MTTLLSVYLGVFGLGDAEIALVLIVLAILLIPFVLWLLALIDILKNDFEGSDKLLWLIIVFIIPLLGSILYFAIGRKSRIMKTT